MKKTWIYFLIIIICIMGIIAGLFVFRKNTEKKVALKNDNIEINNDNITDDCTSEYLELEREENDIETSSTQEKISPNCLLILKRYYKECGHTLSEYIAIPKNLVNGTEEDLKKEYPNWTIEKFSKSQIILYKEFENNCGQHFVLRNNNEKITVYLIDENNQESVYENTNISTEYLTETDKIELKNGIRVNGLEELNKMLENYE